VKIGAAVGVGALACASTLAMAPAPASAAPAPSSSSAAAGLSVSGQVTCAAGQPVDGVWVNSSGGGSNYAKWRATSRSSASYSTRLPTSTPTAISLHVGCGGSAVDWESANWTPAVLMVVRSETINADCARGQCGFPSADRAVAWAERHLTITGGGNRAVSGDRVSDERAYASWAGLDLAFAISAYLNGAGAMPRPMLTGSAATANSMYQLYATDHLVQHAWVTSSGVSPAPPAGALVFYPSSASGGRIAISAGSGEVVSVGSSGSPLVTEQSYSSIPGYHGWAFPTNMVDGRPGSPLLPTAPYRPRRHARAGTAHPAKSAVIGRPSRPAPVGVANRWLSDALAGCLVLLAMFAAAFAVRALLTARRRYSRQRHEDAASPAGAPNGDNSAGGIRQAADRPLGASGWVTPPSPPLRTLPPAREPSRVEPLAPGPSVSGPPAAPLSMPAATSGQAGDAVPAARQRSPSMAEPVTVGGSGLGAKVGNGAAEGETPAPRRGEGWPTRVEPPELSPAGLRLLGLREVEDGVGAGVIHRHEVELGDCRVEAVLAQAPSNSRNSRSPEGRGWVASAPYLVWTPLPHDVPSGGIAFACLGAGKGGCLFIDLAAAPGALTLRGEPQAASRLAESLAHQLCAGPAADQVHLVVVGDAVPAPAPPGAECVASIGKLGSRPEPGPARSAELVFCRVMSDQDVLGLARYVASAPYRVVPVILADLPGAPWSFTAHPSRDPAQTLQPLMS
jgi:hypothetical protein